MQKMAREKWSEWREVNAIEDIVLRKEKIQLLTDIYCSDSKESTNVYW